MRSRGNIVPGRMGAGLMSYSRRAALGPFNIACHGNSLTAAPITTIEQYPYLLGQLRPTAVVNLRSTGNILTHDLTLEFEAQIHNVYYDPTKPNAVYLWEGLDTIHDHPTQNAGIVGAAASAAFCYSNYQAYVTLAKSFNWRVVVCTVIDCFEFADQPVYASARSQFNTLLRSDFAGGHAIADYAARPELSDATNLTYFDFYGIHITAAGAVAVATEANAAYERLMYAA